MYEHNLTLHRGPAVDYARITSLHPRPAPAASRPRWGVAAARGLLLGSGRGRAVRVAVLAAVLLALISLAFARAVGAESGTTYDAVVVQPGDTLWSIAAARYPTDDPRARVDDIERANHLSDPVVHAGQRLLLPRTN